MPTSKNVEINAVAKGDNPKLREAFITIEKKKIYANTYIRELTEFLIDTANENSVLLECSSKYSADLLFFQIAEEITVANIKEIYSLIPSESEALIPIPSPETTNAKDGLVEIGKSLAYSSSLIFPFLYRLVEKCAPMGNPQMFPKINAGALQPLMPIILVNIFPNRLSFFMLILLIKKSDKIINGNMAGNTEDRQSLIEAFKASLTALCLKIIIEEKVTAHIKIKRFLTLEAPSHFEILFILHLPKHIMLKKYEKSKGKITYERKKYN